jgi:hypothetical protein
MAAGDAAESRRLAALPGAYPLHPAHVAMVTDVKAIANGTDISAQIAVDTAVG